VTGSVSPLMLNPVPLALAAEIVRLVPPLFVKVSDRLELLPTVTLPNAKLVGLGVSVPCATPVPESGMLRLGLLPLEVTLTPPLTAPLDVGANVTVNEALWPAFNVTGTASPLILNPVPLALAAEIVRLVPPLLVSVWVSAFEVPTVTFPNAWLVGLAVSVPWVTAVPESAMLVGELNASETMLTDPLTAPPLAGVKVTVNVTL
jgi:hypothetical protein